MWPECLEKGDNGVPSKTPEHCPGVHGKPHPEKELDLERSCWRWRLGPNVPGVGNSIHPVTSKEPPEKPDNNSPLTHAAKYWLLNDGSLWAIEEINSHC